MYCFPVFRLGDFFIGCCLGKYYVQKGVKQKHNISKFKGTIIEILAVILTIGICVWQSQSHSSLILQALNNRTTLFIPLAVIWIYLFAVNYGLITDFFSNKYMIYLGNISAYTFLIHYVIVQYTSSCLNFLNIGLPDLLKAIIIVLEFVLTILCANIYIRLKNRVRKQKPSFMN